MPIIQPTQTRERSVATSGPLDPRSDRYRHLTLNNLGPARRPDWDKVPGTDTSIAWSHAGANHTRDVQGSSNTRRGPANSEEYQSAVAIGNPNAFRNSSFSQLAAVIGDQSGTNVEVAHGGGGRYVKSTMTFELDSTSRSSPPPAMYQTPTAVAPPTAVEWTSNYQPELLQAQYETPYDPSCYPYVAYSDPYQQYPAQSPLQSVPTHYQSYGEYHLSDQELHNMSDDDLRLAIAATSMQPFPDPTSPFLGYAGDYTQIAGPTIHQYDSSFPPDYATHMGTHTASSRHFTDDIQVLDIDDDAATEDV